MAAACAARNVPILRHAHCYVYMLYMRFEALHCHAIALPGTSLSLKALVACSLPWRKSEQHLPQLPCKVHG